MAKLRFGFVGALLAIICIVIAYALPWYRLRFETVDGPALFPDFTITWSWADVVTEADNGDRTVHSYTEVPEAPAVKAIFDTCLSFLVLGMAATIAMALVMIIVLIRDKCFSSKVWKILALVTGVAALVLLAISFFTFLGITDAFVEDGQCSFFGQTYLHCSEFMGSEEASAVFWKFETTFGPWIGWWMVLVAMVCVLGSLISSVLSGR